jgi:hypothetical protein
MSHSALRYASLVGRVIRAERLATDEERELFGSETMGAQGTVCMVGDRDGGGVEIIFSDNWPGLIVRPDEEWSYMIFVDEAALDGYNAAMAAELERRARR